MVYRGNKKPWILILKWIKKIVTCASLQDPDIENSNTEKL